MKTCNAFFIIKEEGINLEVKITKTYGNIVSFRFASTEAWNNYRSFHFQNNPLTNEYIVIGGKVYEIYGLKNVINFRCRPAKGYSCGTLQTFKLDEEENKAWLEKNKMTIILAGL